ncbi:hypothetical protein OAF80_00415 [bacterium]|nr:hypothetical protein [bacterium]
MTTSILYIHGLDSSPKPSKLKLLESFGTVYALHLNYRQQADPFKALSKEIEHNGITHVIGSSMGGYLGFWLAEKHSLPCLLFNPALDMRSIDLSVERNYNQSPKRLIVLGEQDEVVDPFNTIDFLKRTSHTKVAQQVIIDSKMEHRITEEKFEYYTNLFFTNG